MSACGELVDELLRRVRDPQGTANPRALVRDLLDRAQVLFVRSTGTLIIESSVTMQPEQLLYEIDPATTLRILDLFVEDRRLWPIRWPQMQAQRSPLWWRGSALAGPRVWAPLSTIHYIIYPAITALSPNTTLTMRAQKRPNGLGADDVEMEIPNEFFPRLLDFVEAAIYIRQRDPALPAALERIAPLAPEHEEVA